MSLITVIMPMRNAERWVRQSPASVLSQCGVELDVLVIDDGSTDRSAQVVQSIGDPRVRILAGPQRGISAAFNAGLGEARGQFIARCDADDLYPAGRLDWQARWMLSHPDFGAVCGQFSTIDARGNIVAHHSHDKPEQDVTQELLSGVGRSHMCAYLFRKDVLQKLGGCREWFTTSEDADLQFRLAGMAKVGFVPKLAYEYRLHDASITHTQQSPRRKFYEDAARRFLEQRRHSGADDLDRNHPPALPADMVDQSAQSSAAQIQAILIGQAWDLHRTGNKRQAIGKGWRACLQRPVSISAWKSLIALVIKS